MASTQQAQTRGGESYDHRLHQGELMEDLRWASDRRAAWESPCEPSSGANVGSGERIISLAAGSLLSLLGLERRDKLGWAIASIGGAMLYRGATGRCYLYQTLDVSTADEQPRAISGELRARSPARIPAKDGIQISQTFLINQPAEKLYDYWRRLENLPHVLTHLKSVQVLDERHSHWVAHAPGIAGGEVQWDAEIIADEPGSRIAWRSLPGSTVESHGSVGFTPTSDDRGTAVHVEMKYLPPGGQLGHWISKLFGEAPDQQIREDLRNFKRLMETGEVLTIAGQPRGQCR